MKRWDQTLWRMHNLERLMLNSARARAKKAGLMFNIDLKDVIIPEFCPYLGVRFETGVGTNLYQRYAPSLDRIDNSKGYVKGNVEVITRQANTMKNSASKEELLEFAYSILDRY